MGIKWHVNVVGPHLSNKPVCDFGFFIKLWKIKHQFVQNNHINLINDYLLTEYSRVSRLIII